MKTYLHDLTQMDDILTRYVFPFSFHLIGAITVWIVGNMLIRSFQGLLHASLLRKRMDATLMSYARGTSGLVLRVILLLIVLDIFGIQTTSLSAILAAAGVAIGVACSGLLSNFAAGVFLIIFRPFRVGDNISAGSVTGTVREIGIFATVLASGDHSQLFIGNNKVFSDIILNYSVNDYRYINLKVQLAHGTDPIQAIEQLTTRLKQMPGVRPETGVVGDIAEFNALGILLNLKYTVVPQDYDRLVALGNRTIYQVISEFNYAVPQTRTMLIQSAGASNPTLPL